MAFGETVMSRSPTPAQIGQEVRRALAAGWWNATLTKTPGEISFSHRDPSDREASQPAYSPGKFIAACSPTGAVTGIGVWRPARSAMARGASQGTCFGLYLRRRAKP